LKSSAADWSVMVLTPASMIVLYPHVYKTLSYNALQDFTRSRRSAISRSC
jgi:hypothetical protein